MHRVLVVGTGSIGERHVRCFLQTGRAEVGICEINDDLRAQITDRYGITKTYSRLEDAAAESWDAGLVATPAHLHIPMAAALAESGCSLLLEKPLSVSMAGVDELIEFVEKKKIPAMVAYVWRSHPGIKKLKEALDSGRFGKPLLIIVNTGQNFPTYRPAYRDIYYKNRATGGGAIQDGITHMFNAAEWLVGPITRICTDADHKVLEGVEVEDTVNSLTRHGDVMGCFSLNQFQAPNEMTITVNCERGTVRFETHTQSWRWMVEPDEGWHIEPVVSKERDEMYIAQANRFLDTVEGKTAPLCSLKEALQTLRVNLAALTSADNRGAWQTVCLS